MVYKVIEAAGNEGPFSAASHFEARVIFGAKRKS